MSGQLQRLQSQGEVMGSYSNRTKDGPSEMRKDLVR